MHKKICTPLTPPPPVTYSTPLEIMTPEGYTLHLCQLHRQEICSVCRCNHSISNSNRRYLALLKHSNQVSKEEDQQPSELKQCSNPNCQSRWEATEDFIPPIIPLEQLSPCASCRRAVYCSQSCQREHQTEHEMICKLFSSMFRDGPEVRMSLRPGIILEEIWEGAPTGLRMKIIFFNGDIEPSSSLCSAPYYILEYLRQDPPLPQISSEIIFEEALPTTETAVPTLWRRHPSQSTLERYVNLQATDTFVRILQTDDSTGVMLCTVEPWVNGRHVVAGEGVAEGEGKRFVVISCRAVHEGKKWRVV
jgi:hypothetical protein